MMKVDDRKILSNNFQIQDFNTDTCKLYCRLILFLLNNKIKLEDMIIGFFLINKDLWFRKRSEW